jgi:hypothetical protein
MKQTYKLSESQIEKLKKRYVDGESLESLVDTFHIGKTGIQYHCASLTPKRKHNILLKRLNELREKLTSFQIGYLAGLIDGEGWLGIEERGNSYGLRITVCMTSNKTIQYLQSLLSGHVYIKKEGYRYNQKPQYVWEIWSVEDVGSLLLLIKDYLVTKSQNAEVLLEFAKVKLDNWNNPNVEREKQLYLENKRLNRKGLML